MSVSGANGKLKHASQTMLACWADISQYWRDANSEAFEQQHLKPVMTKLRSAEKAMAHMEDVLNKVFQDCTTDQERLS